MAASWVAFSTRFGYNLCCQIVRRWRRLDARPAKQNPIFAVNRMNPRVAWGYFALFLAMSAAPLSAQIITDFTPTLGSAGDSIMINGSGFAATDKVYFYNGLSTWALAAATVTSTSQIQATVPPGVMTGPIGVRIGTGSTSCGSGGFNCSSGDFK